MLANAVGIVGCMMSIIPEFHTVMAGRFVYGISAGIMFGLVPKMLMEYLSIEEFEKGYGLIPNFAIEFFKLSYIGFNFVYMLIKNDSIDDTKDWYWIFNFALPAPFMFLSLVLFLMCAKKDSFSHIFENEEDDPTLQKMRAIEYLKFMIS